MTLTLLRPTLEATTLGFTDLAHEEGTSEVVQVKCKRGRLVGAKSKKGKVLKKCGLEPLRLTYPVVTSSTPCPTDKSKAKI